MARPCTKPPGAASSRCSRLSALPIAVLLAVVALVTWAATVPPLRLTQFERMPPPAEAGSAPTPGLEMRGAPSDGILQAAPDAAGQARWLRTRFVLSAVPQDPVALYLASASRARVFVNGVQIGNTSVSDAESFGWNHPVFYSVPATLLRAGENTIDLRLLLNRFGQGAVRGLQLGPHAALQRQYDQVFFWRVTGPQITSGVMLLLGMPALLLWLRRREETVYGWFAAACVTAALRNGHLFLAVPELSRWYEAWSAVPMHWMLVSLMMFSFRLCRRRFPRVERALFLTTGVWTVALLLARGPGVFNLGYFWLTGVWIAVMLFVALQCWRAPRLELGLLLLALVVAQVLGALDLALLLGLRESDSRIFLVPYSMVVFALVMGANLVDALARSRTQQERLNQQLDARLAQREREIAAEHRRVLHLQREQAAAGERERIMRELHDGLGSSLISSIQAVEAGELAGPALAGVLRECVDDLRLALDSMRPSGSELLPVLGNFRYRMQPRLAQAGVRLDWQVATDAVSPVLGPDQVLHTLRIVQEAFANALKHAAPSCIGVRFESHADGGWLLRVTDDGPGFDAPTAPGQGNGLHNMRSRAVLIPARLSIGRDASGTAVELRCVGGGLQVP